jgi:hypothetical protein
LVRGTFNRRFDGCGCSLKKKRGTHKLEDELEGATWLTNSLSFVLFVPFVASSLYFFTGFVVG